MSQARYAVGAAILVALSVGDMALGQGVYLSGSGPVHRGMGGASAAAPIDAIGALYWNPATISGLENSELGFGLDLILANHEVSSSVGPFSGSTDSEPGVVPVPSVGWVYHMPDPRITLGLGVGGVAGFRTNLPADPTNPALAPQPTGLGNISSEANFLQMTPVISFALAENLSVAAGPVITLGQIGLEPFVFDPPNTDFTYASGRASRYHWGGGAQAGVYYIRNNCWHLGASLKSPAWMEEMRFFGQDANGGRRVLRSNVDLPMIVSLGAAYSGIPDWLIALDVRYVDYKNTDGFGDRAVFDSMGELGGLDWSSVFAMALGVQRRLGEQLYARMGYAYNQNPIKHSESFYNSGSPLIYEHTISVGASYRLSEATALSLAYSYMPEVERTGPIVTPLGEVPGSSVTNTLDVHFISFGIVMRN